MIMPTFANTRSSFHISIPSVLSAFALIGAINSLIVGANQLLMPLAVQYFNSAITRGNYDIFLLREETLSWPLVLSNFTLAIVWSSLAFIFAYWIDPKPGNRRRSAFE